jgi:rod shape determining protein RodA
VLKKAFQKLISSLNWEGNISAFIQRTDWWLPLLLALLSSWGVAAIYSTGSLKEPILWEQGFARQQIIFVALGWAVYWVVSLIDYKVFERYARWLYIGGIVLLLPIAICALGHFDLGTIIELRGGARRWITLGGPFNIQSSEIAKFTTLIMLSLIAGRGLVVGQLSKLELAAARVIRVFIPNKLAGTLPRYIPLIIRVAWMSFLPFALIFVQPDLASSLIYIPMAFALLFVANVPLRFFAFIGALLLPLAALLTVDMVRYGEALVAYQEAHPDSKNPAAGIRETFKDGILPMRNYQRERIMAFLRPELIDPSGSGATWQVRQAQIAIGQGSFSGEGFRQGMQARLGYLPEGAAHNDFLFSSIAEESGFIGGCSIIGLFALVIGITFRIAIKARDRFGSCLAVGVAVIVALHVVINIGMNIGAMPVTGVPLPFLSYGGSFVLSCFLLFGLVQSVHRSSQPLPAHNPDNADLLAPSQLAGRAPV